MFTKKWTVWFLASLLSLILSLSVANPARAEGDTPEPPSNCIACHENLYYLHDTGKHFCVSEAKDRCTDCHDGDATATNKDAAHTERSAHPVTNDDTSKCQECHPADCAEYVQKFQAMAGISPVLVAAQPILHNRLSQSYHETQEKHYDTSTLFIPIMAGLGIILLALTAFVIHIIRHA